MNTVDVLLAGKLVPGADQDRAAAALAKMTGLDPAKTRLLLCSGKPRLAKRGLTPAAGEALVAKFAALGIAALIRPSAATGAGAGTAAAAQGASPAAARAAAPPMPEKIEGLTMDWSVPKEKPEPEPETREFMETVQAQPRKNPGAATPEDGKGAAPLNPYAAPKASLDNPSRRLDLWALEANEVPAANGLEWAKDTWALMMGSGRLWAGAILCCALVFMLAMAMASKGGNVALGLLYPYMASVLVMMASRQEQGEEDSLGAALFGKGAVADLGRDEVKAIFSRMLRLGLLGVLYQIVVGVLVALAIGVSTIQAMADGQAPVFSQFVGTMLFGLLLLILLCVPLLVVAFFAPTLGTLAGNGVLACVRKSIAAGLKNWKALLVNCAVGCGVLLLAGVLLGVVIIVTDSEMLTLAASALLASMLWSFFSIMGYFATKDVFSKD